MPANPRAQSLLLLIALVAGAGCGTQATVQAAPRPPVPAASSPSAAPAASTAPAPSAPPSASAPPSPAAAPLPPPAVAARPVTMGFPLVAVAEAVRGQVTVTLLPGSYRLQVQASGLPPGSVHSVHLHFGTCPSAGVHLSVLGNLVADGAGAGSLSVTVGRPYAGNGRFVIVYLGPSAGPLAACAQLAG